MLTATANTKRGELLKLRMQVGSSAACPASASLGRKDDCERRVAAGRRAEERRRHQQRRAEVKERRRSQQQRSGSRAKEGGVPAAVVEGDACSGAAQPAPQTVATSGVTRCGA